MDKKNVSKKPWEKEEAIVLKGWTSQRRQDFNKDTKERSELATQIWGEAGEKSIATRGNCQHKVLSYVPESD